MVYNMKNLFKQKVKEILKRNTFHYVEIIKPYGGVF